VHGQLRQQSIVAFFLCLMQARPIKRINITRNWLPLIVMLRLRRCPYSKQSKQLQGILCKSSANTLYTVYTSVEGSTGLLFQHSQSTNHYYSWAACSSSARMVSSTHKLLCVQCSAVHCSCSKAKYQPDHVSLLLKHSPSCTPCTK
jgi:hypothetical protein